MGYDSPPPILAQKTLDGIKPYNRYSADATSDDANGQVYKLTPRKGRLTARNSAYWVGLGIAVKATDAWPTRSHLHTDLKRLCGYVEVAHNPLTGNDEVRVQSTAFDKMKEPEFRAYFRMAQQRFIAKMGFDPWERKEGQATERGHVLTIPEEKT